MQFDTSVLSDNELDAFAKSFFSQETLPINTPQESQLPQYYVQPSKPWLEMEMELKQRLQQLYEEKERLSQQLSQRHRDPQIISVAQTQAITREPIGYVLLDGTRIVFMNDVLRYKLGWMNVDLKEAIYTCEDIIHPMDVSRSTMCCVKNLINKENVTLLENMTMRKRGMDLKDPHCMVFCHKIFWKHTFVGTSVQAYKRTSEGMYYF
jgi:hypothetical protein